MPQTTYLPLYTASYPILAPVQKPGGVTVLATVGPGDVPNKPTYSAGTIQSLVVEDEENASVAQAEVEEAPEEVEEEETPHHRGRRGRRR
jgi:hypothetical protein